MKPSTPTAIKAVTMMKTFVAVLLFFSKPGFTAMRAV